MCIIEKWWPFLHILKITQYMSYLDSSTFCSLTHFSNMWGWQFDSSGGPVFYTLWKLQLYNKDVLSQVVAFSQYRRKKILIRIAGKNSLGKTPQAAHCEACKPSFTASEAFSSRYKSRSLPCTSLQILELLLPFSYTVFLKCFKGRNVSAQSNPSELSARDARPWLIREAKSAATRFV